MPDSHTEMLNLEYLRQDGRLHVIRIKRCSVIIDVILTFNNFSLPALWIEVNDFRRILFIIARRLGLFPTHTVVT